MRISGLRRERARAMVTLLIILILGAALRFYRLGLVPPGFQFDEAYNVIDAVHVLEGEWQIFFPANGGREPLYTYWQALFVAGLGPNVFALRLASAVAGVATIALTYVLVRALLPHQPRRVATLTAAFLALSYWHIHFSRYAIRAILLPPLTILTFYGFWQGLEARRRPYLYLTVSGIFLAAAVYAHPAARLLPLVLAPFALYRALSHRAQARRYLGGLALVGLIAVVLLLPLGHYFWEHPWLFSGHPRDVSIFDPRVNEGDIPRALLTNLTRVAGMFTWRGDRSRFHNLPYRPVFDPLSALAFLAGVVAWAVTLVRRGERAPYLFLGLWIGVMVLPTLFSDKAPNFSRAMGALPAICFLPALGLSAIWDRCPWPIARRLPLVPLLVLFTSGLWTAHDYYVAFARDPELYYSYDVDKIDAAAYLNRAARQGQVYLTPLWASHATVAFLTRQANIRSVELGQTLVLPGNRQGAYYVFPAEQEAQSAALGAWLGGLARRELVTDRYGEPLLIVYHLPAANQPRFGPGSEAQDGPLRPQHLKPARFADQIELLGFSLSGEGYTEEAVMAGQPLSLTLFWRGLKPMARNYTAFVHLVDSQGQRWGQQDKEPGGGSYRTTAWEPGEVIIDRFQLVVDPCAPPGSYKVLVGWYDLEMEERLPVTGGEMRVVNLATLQVRPARGLSPDQVAPQQRLDAVLRGAIRLLGYDGHSAELRPGDELSLTLYWQATGRMDRDLEFAIQVWDPATGRVWQLDRGAPPVPTSEWAAGEVICDHRRLQLPLDLSGGTYQLEVATAEGQAIALEGLTLQVRERRFTLPQPRVSLKANLGDQVTLLGYDLEETRVAPGGRLHLTLYWQAQADMDISYTVFTHLLDAQQRIWGQVDNVPVQGTYPTIGWLPGEVVADEYAIPVAPDAPPGVYAIEVGMYDAATGARLPVTINGLRVPDDRVLLDITVDVR